MPIQSILLVDDDANTLLVAEMSLESDFDVFCADSGHAGLIIAELEQPDLILLDVRMPNMDGPSMLRRLREHPSTKNIPVIFMSARIQSHETADYQKYAIAGLIEKPFDPIGLPNLIRKLTLNLSCRFSDVIGLLDFNID